MTDAIDLFGGAGGAAVGMGLIGLTEHGIEWGEQECATREAAGFPVTRADVSTLDPAEWAGVEGMWASPPCPDWSVAGKGAGRAGKSGWLVDEPLRWAKVIRPRWIAMENVPPVEAVFKAQALELQALGYRTWVGVLSAEEYGVPQTRRRAHLMASLDGPVGPPAPTHQPYVYGVPAQEVITWSGTLRPWVSMAEALGWGANVEVGLLRGEGFTERHGDRPSRRATEPGFSVTTHARDWTVQTGANTMKHSRDPDEVERYERSLDAPAPTVDAKTGSAWLLQPGKYAAMEYGNRRLYEPDEPAPTIAFGHDSAQWCWVRPATTIAGDPRCFPPGGHHEPGQQSEGSIKLTVQEALALQAMPTNYPVQGSRTAQFRQVGNLVVPFIAAALVGELTGRDWRAAIDEVTGGR